MAIDKLVDSSQLDTDLTSIANAIRAKGGTSAQLTFPNEFVTAINAISGGGGSTLVTKTITENGTYSASDDSADGYSEVTVNVPTSGSSAWTKVVETSYQVSTTYTSSTTVATLKTDSEIWTSNKIVYVRIRDTAGPRAGYFYGSDTFFMNMYPQNESTTLSVSTGLIYNIWRYESTGKYNCRYGYTNVGYGLYVDQISYNGEVRVKVRYHSSYSLTIDGTYKVEIYLLDPPSGAPIFE